MNCWKYEHTYNLRDGRITELTRPIYRGGAYDFVAELRLLHKIGAQDA